MKVKLLMVNDGCRIYFLPTIRLEYPGDDDYYYLEFLFLKFCIGLNFIPKEKKGLKNV